MQQSKLTFTRASLDKKPKVKKIAKVVTEKPDVKEGKMEIEEAP